MAVVVTLEEDIVFKESHVGNEKYKTMDIYRKRGTLKLWDSERG